MLTTPRHATHASRVALEPVAGDVTWPIATRRPLEVGQTVWGVATLNLPIENTELSRTDKTAVDWVAPTWTNGVVKGLR